MLVAADNDVECDIIEYQEPCEGVMLSETSREHLHVEMTSDAAMLPHKLTVSGIGDLELSVFKAHFEYRDAFFLDANLTAGLGRA